jgi:hypothetical protein
MSISTVNKMILCYVLKNYIFIIINFTISKLCYIV